MEVCPPHVSPACPPVTVTVGRNCLPEEASERAVVTAGHQFSLVVVKFCLLRSFPREKCKNAKSPLREPTGEMARHTMSACPLREERVKRREEREETVRRRARGRLPRKCLPQPRRESVPAPPPVCV